jgi:hypothetical protein
MNYDMLWQCTVQYCTVPVPARKHATSAFGALYRRQMQQQSLVCVVCREFCVRTVIVEVSGSRGVLVA